MRIKIKEKIFPISFIFVTVLILVLAVLGNKVFMFQPYAYSVDEISDLNIINKIYSISSIADFLLLFFIFNPDPYHGFITYLIPATISFIPYKLGGEPYLLFTHRMCSALFLIASYILFSFTFFQKISHRFFFYFMLLVLPFTNMFIMWPRCESYQYFFMALFFWFQKKHQWNVLWPFLFLGLSLASRISTAPYVAVLLACFLYLHKGEGKNLFKLGLKASCYSLIGLVIGIPHLLYPLNIYKWINKKYFQIFNDTGMDVNFTFTEWLESAVFHYTGHNINFYIMIVLMFASPFLIRRLVSQWVERPTENDKKWIIVSLALGFTGLITFLAIMYKVKIVSSYWYLQQHYIFWIIGILVPYTILKSQTAKKTLKYTFAYFLFIALVFNFELSPFFVNHTWAFYKEIPRAKRKANLLHEENYQAIMAKLGQVQKQVGRKVNVRVMADIWQPRSNELFRIEPSWVPSPFARYDKVQVKPEIIVVNSELYFPPEKLLQNFPEGEREIREEGFKLYQEHLCPSAGGNSEHENCFKSLTVNDKYVILYNKSLNLTNL